jgi:hypothetical protein
VVKRLTPIISDKKPPSSHTYVNTKTTELESERDERPKSVSEMIRKMNAPKILSSNIPGNIHM